MFNGNGGRMAKRASRGKRCTRFAFTRGNELRSSLEPVQCPECPHCLAAAVERDAQQQSLQDQYARRHRLKDDDDDHRRIG